MAILSLPTCILILFAAVSWIYFSLHRFLIRSLLTKTRWVVHRPTASHPNSHLLDTVRVDIDTFEKLAEDRHQHHGKVTLLEASTVLLRNRIWLVEDASVVFRAEIAKHAGDHAELARDHAELARDHAVLARGHAELLRIKDAVTSERDRVVAERDGMADRIAALHAENDAMRTSKAGLMEDLEELKAEIEELIDGKESIMVEKMVLEQRLAQAEANACKTATELKRSREQRQMLETHLAMKEEALGDLIDELEGLEEDLRNSKRSWCDAQSEIDDVRATNDAVIEENDGLKSTLETLRRTSVPKTMLEALQRSTVPKTELDALCRATVPLSDVHALAAELRVTKDALAARDAEMATKLAERDTYIAGLERAIEYLKLASPARRSSAVPVLSPGTPSSSSSSPPAPVHKTSLASPSAFETPTKRPASVSLLLRALETPVSAVQSLSYFKSSSASASTLALAHASSMAVAPALKSPESPLMRPRWSLILPAIGAASSSSSSSSAARSPAASDSDSPSDSGSGSRSPWRGWWS